MVNVISDPYRPSNQVSDVETEIVIYERHAMRPTLHGKCTEGLVETNTHAKDREQVDEISSYPTIVIRMNRFPRNTA